jgi:hypothetical protein
MSPRPAAYGLGLGLVAGQEDGVSRAPDPTRPVEGTTACTEPAAEHRIYHAPPLITRPPHLTSATERRPRSWTCARPYPGSGAVGPAETIHDASRYRGDPLTSLARGVSGTGFPWSHS